MTVAEWEGAFVNPAILFGRMPFHIFMQAWRELPGFRWCIRVILAAYILPLTIVGGMFFLCWCLLKGVVYLASFFWRCPACGSHGRWAWPETGPLAFP
jgi:hypothetical protein